MVAVCGGGMAKIGIAGTDENKRIEQAQIGIAGEVKGHTIASARFGMGGLNDRHIIEAGQQANFGISGLDRVAKCAVAGPNTRPIVESSQGAMGIAGNMGGGLRSEVANNVVDVAAFRRRDESLATISRESNRLGDRAAREAWKHGVWFADFTYVATPYEETENGGYVLRSDGGIGWRNGRETVFSKPCRELPFFVDSCAYRREITGAAPQWAKSFSIYPQVIELLEPDGYASWDYPDNRARSMQTMHELMSLFPDDVINGRLWPVFSIRWSWRSKAHLNFGRLPGWASRELASLVPLNRTQRPFKDETREKWARQALANALVMADDPDFLYLVNTFGRVMIGGMVGGPCPRMARHVFAAALCTLFPCVQFWLLGQANFAVVNGLGALGLLDQVWTDGTWWIKDATAERFAIVEDGLITMLSLESNYRKQSFFTLIEMMAANLRSLLAAYEGLWAWPPPEPIPSDLLDVDNVKELKARMQAAQLEMGL